MIHELDIFFVILQDRGRIFLLTHMRAIEFVQDPIFPLSRRGSKFPKDCSSAFMCSLCADGLAISDEKKDTKITGANFLAFSLLLGEKEREISTSVPARKRPDMDIAVARDRNGYLPHWLLRTGVRHFHSSNFFPQKFSLDLVPIVISRKTCDVAHLSRDITFLL